QDDGGDAELAWIGDLGDGNPSLGKRAESKPGIQHPLRRDRCEPAAVATSRRIGKPAADVDDDVYAARQVVDADLATGAEGDANPVGYGLAGHEVEVGRQRPRGAAGENAEISARARIRRRDIEDDSGDAGRRNAAPAGDLQVQGGSLAERPEA